MARKSFIEVLVENVKNFFIITVPSFIVFILLLELIFRFAFPTTQIPYGYFDTDHNIYRFDTEGPRSGRRTFGATAHYGIDWEVNNAGWISSIDYLPKKERNKKLMALIGDSYIEGMSIDNKNHAGAQLNGMLPDSVVCYEFGIAWAPMSQYLNMSRYVKKVFEPDILVFSIVHNDFLSCWRDAEFIGHFMQLGEENGEIKELPIYPAKKSLMRRILRKSALGRYLTINAKLAFRLKSLKYQLKGNRTQFNANIDVEANKKQADRVQKAIDYVIGKIREENPGIPILFTMDAPRQDIYNNSVETSSVLFLYKSLEQACEKFGCHYIDLTKPFQEHYLEHGEKFEFAWDNHWNPLGHQLVAEAVYAKLTELGLVPVETDAKE